MNNLKKKKKKESLEKLNLMKNEKIIISLSEFSDKSKNNYTQSMVRIFINIFLPLH